MPSSPLALKYAKAFTKSAVNLTFGTTLEYACPGSNLRQNGMSY